MLCRWLAISSLLLGLAAHAATRPHYGGTLRVETRATLSSLNPAQAAASDSIVRHNLIPLISDTLVGLDANAFPVPRLATRWQNDNGNKRWEFWIRAGVFLHNGASLTPAYVAQSLAAANSGWKVRANSESVIVESELPLPNLPVELSRPGYSIVVPGADGHSIGTGPFRVEDFQPGRRLLLRANDEYWNGRPYVDIVDVGLNVSLTDQAMHQQLGRADVIDGTPSSAHSTEDSRRTMLSPPVELFAITFPHGSGPAEDPRLRHALSLAIDRSAIQTILLQRRGEPAYSLLPQWISGYAYLFRVPADIARARQLRSEVPAATAGIALAYEPGDPLAQAIAERVAVNARDANINVTVSPLTSAPASAARIVRVAPASTDPQSALAEITSSIDAAQLPRVLTSGSAEELYAAERTLLDDYRILPIVHVPQSYSLGPRVRNWTAQPNGGWPLENVWLDPGRERTTP